MRKIIFLFLLFVITSGFENPSDHYALIPGKYECSSSSTVTLKLKKNGTFRYSFHLIRTLTLRGKWSVSGDTVLLDFDSDHADARFVSDHYGHLNSLDSSCSFTKLRLN